MYRILIAEDEKIVRDSYKDFLTKDIENIEVLTARNGIEAIEISERYPPDIVLLDINMPGLNGIDVIKEIRIKNKNIVFIIISAYDDFNFAQEAMALGVFEYVVKPVLRDVLIDTVSRAIEKIKELKKYGEQNIKIKELNERIRNILEQNFIYSLILNDNYVDIYNEYSDIFEINAQKGHIILINCKNCSDENKKIYMEQVLHYIKKNYKIIGSIVKKNKVIIFLPSNEDMKIEISETLINILSKKNIENWDWNISEHITLEELNAEYHKMISKSNEKNSINYEEIFSISEDIVKKCLKGKKEELDNSIYNLEKLVLSNFFTLEDLIELLIEIFAAVFVKNDFELKIEEIKKLKFNYAIEIIKFNNKFEAFEFFKLKINEICCLIANNNIKNETISEIVKFINENFNKEIALEDIANKFYISPQYLSKLFKEQTGKNFSDYIIMLRLNKAKELLKSGKKSIKDVSYAVGYNDPNYFSRLFKKEIGISPSEYNK